MDHDVLMFAQVMAIIVPSAVVLTAMGVIAHRVVETTNKRARIAEPQRT